MEKTFEDRYEFVFELHGSIQVLHDYSFMHLRRRNCVESVALFELTQKLEPFDEIKSLRRLRKQIRKVDSLLEEYSKHLI